MASDNDPPFFRYLRDLTVCLARFTRLPLPEGAAEAGRGLDRALWAAPVVGAALGGSAALAYLIATALGLTAGLAAVVAVGVLVALTGGAPERALVRAAGVMWPRLGEAGMIALVLWLAVRVGTLAAIAAPGAVGGALVGAVAIGYAALVVAVFAAADPAADGLAGEIGRAPIEPVVAAGAIAAVLALIVLPGGWIAAVILATAATWGTARLARRRGPGAAATVALAAQPVAEGLALLAAVAAAPG